MEGSCSLALCSTKPCAVIYSRRWKQKLPLTLTHERGKKKISIQVFKRTKKRENKYLYLFSTGTVYTALRSAYKSGIRHRNDWTIKIFASLLNNWNNYENNVFNLIICDCLYLALNKRWNVNFNKYICCGSTMKLSTVSPVSKCTFVNMGGGNVIWSITLFTIILTPWGKIWLGAPERGRLMIILYFFHLQITTPTLVTFLLIGWN